MLKGRGCGDPDGREDHGSTDRSASLDERIRQARAKLDQLREDLKTNHSQ
jgi:hypothetical protein